MPISRNIVKNKQGNVEDRLLEMVTTIVRKYKHPMGELGWINLIVDMMNVDHELSRGLFNKLHKLKIIKHLRVKDNENIYHSDMMPHSNRDSIL